MQTHTNSPINFKKISLLVFMLAFMASVSLYAQEEVKPRPSPLEMKTMKYENAYVKVTYCRPHKRDREIFGNLVPYGKVWRTGANEATEITTTSDLKIMGKTLPKGTYTIFSIPEKDKWTIIFNKELGQWGAYNYDESKDLFRVEMPVQTSDVVYEAFTIDFKIEEDKHFMEFRWDTVLVTLPIEFMK